MEKTSTATNTKKRTKMMTSKQATKELFDEIIYIDLFNRSVFFYSDVEKYKKAIAYRDGIEHEVSSAISYRSVLEDDVIYMIGIFNNSINCLVHESVHIASFIMEDIGQKLDYQDELLPYLTQGIFQGCLDYMKKENK